jgi:hypothetical protein
METDSEEPTETFTVEMLLTEKWGVTNKQRRGEVSLTLV